MAQTKTGSPFYLLSLSNMLDLIRRTSIHFFTVFRWLNEGKTDNKKTMITFSSDDFSAPSESRISEF